MLFTSLSIYTHVKVVNELILDSLGLLLNGINLAESTEGYNLTII